MAISGSRHGVFASSGMHVRGANSNIVKLTVMGENTVDVGVQGVEKSQVCW